MVLFRHWLWLELLQFIQFIFFWIALGGAIVAICSHETAQKLIAFGFYTFAIVTFLILKRIEDKIA